MANMIRSIITWCAAIALTLSGSAATLVPAAPARRVAITIDDLPAVSRNFRGDADRERITRQLVTALERHRVPAIGFVNEGKLYRADTLHAPAVGMLRQWTRAGLELGNHSYSHFDLHVVDLPMHLADIVRGFLPEAQIT